MITHGAHILLLAKVRHRRHHMKRIQSALARLLMQLVCLLLGVILACMLGITVYVQQYMNNMQETAADPLMETHFPDREAISLSSGTPDTAAPLVNILLIGQDAREGEAGSRSDSIILCTYNHNSKKLFFTSFLRDLYVPIPGHGSNRINAAYAFGGSSLLRQTLEENFDLHIDGKVEVDFSQFSEIVDLLGGVRITLRQDEAVLIGEETGTTLQEGLQTLNGQQALAYSRIRKLDTDGDFSRTGRQRTVMKAILDAYRNAGTGTILKLVYNVLPMIDTDMEAGQILALAVSAIPNLSQIEVVSQHIPAAGEYRDQVIDGMAVLVPDMEAAAKTLRNAFR